jgi:O-antigen/teichoic acid export membrane protein
MPFSLFVAVYSAEITRVVLGRKWSGSAPLLLILSLSNFIKQPVGSTAFVLIAQGRSRAYLMLTLLQSVTAIVFMCIGVHWGTGGIAYAEVATTYVLIVPRVYYTFRDSPMGVSAFFTMIARPALASAAMAAVLMMVRQSLPAIGAPAVLAIGTATAALVFPLVWILLPGGSGELFGLVSDVRSALIRKTPSRPEVGMVEVAGDLVRL